MRWLVLKRNENPQTENASTEVRFAGSAASGAWRLPIEQAMTDEYSQKISRIAFDSVSGRFVVFGKQVYDLVGRVSFGADFPNPAARLVERECRAGLGFIKQHTSIRKRLGFNTGAANEYIASRGYHNEYGRGSSRSRDR